MVLMRLEPLRSIGPLQGREAMQVCTNGANPDGKKGAPKGAKMAVIGNRSTGPTGRA